MQTPRHLKADIAEAADRHKREARRNFRKHLLQWFGIFLILNTAVYLLLFVLLRPW